MTTTTGRPVIMVDNLSVTYRVLATGRASEEGRRLLNRRRSTRKVEALKDVSFVAHATESIGIIGPNGSGKSTLMRALVGLTPATSGAVYASTRPNMLGVGAALIPDLSGERNIVLGGLALGFSKSEITEMTPSILDFAELTEFADLPMRTYSSGMQQRLKFAIAAAKQHDILIIDEALAVGDQRFRKRSESRIREIRDQAGTIFLVSHAMGSIRETCSRVLWINKGRLEMDGETEQVIEAYQKSQQR